MPDFSRAPFWRKRLYPTTDLVLFRKNQEEGERDLVRIAQNKKIRHEVAWLFLHTQQAWLNLTAQTGIVQAKNGIIDTMSVMHRSVVPHEDVTDYHTHPLYGIQQNLHSYEHAIRQRFGVEFKPGPHADVLLDVQFALPSECDIAGSKEQTDQFDSDYSINFGVVSPIAITKSTLQKHANSNVIARYMSVTDDAFQDFDRLVEDFNANAFDIATNIAERVNAEIPEIEMDVRPAMPS